ncbi:MAG: TlpA disulfide reductase family protein, partial [Prevotellaceae bacterium]|nr:TlpA disulfide reductase family protein [Prevotellaceae bacterium]
LSLGYYYIDCKEMEELISSAGEDIQSDVLFKMVKKNIALQKKTSAGQMFTDATLKDLDGNTHKLSEYIGKGKYVIMDCWASWCPPCRRLIPELKTLYAQYKSKGVEVIGVATRDEAEDTKKAVEELQIPWTVLTDFDMPTTIRDVYGFEGIPFVIMFDPDGIIIKRDLDEAQIQEMLKVCSINSKKSSQR